MMIDHFKHFAAPGSFIAIDAGDGLRFEALKTAYPDLVVFEWHDRSSDTDNFEELIALAMDVERNQLLVAGGQDVQSCLVISLLALGRGFDVYVCNDLIDGPEEEKSILWDRLRHHGAIVTSTAQIRAEFEAVKNSGISQANG